MEIKSRQSNVELLRIVAMLMIITLHFLGHGKVISSYTIDNCSEFMTYSFVKGLCMIAVNCFILISGYFGVDSPFKPEKILKIALQIWFYSLVIFFVLMISGQINLSYKDYIYAIFPISTNMDGFATIFLIMYILTPFINIMIANLTYKQLRRLFVILVLIFSVIPNIFCFMGTTIEFGGGYGIVWFLVLYITGAFIKKSNIQNLGKGKGILIYAILGLVAPLSSIGAVVIYQITGIMKFWEFKELLYSYTSVPIYLASIAFFVVFLKIEIHNDKICTVINKIATTTFGIYLIHDNRFLRSILWKFLNPSAYVGQPFLFVYMISCVFCIFIICSVIEMLRQLLFSLLYKRKTYKKLIGQLNKFFKT